MIDKRTNITYAQYNEDIILKSLLDGVDNGFYIDIGASYTETDSVTKYFYDRGWRGINIEPIKSLFLDLEKARPRDINLNVGIGEKNGMMAFREYTKLSGHSTFNDQQKQSHKNDEHIDYPVQVITLSEVFKKYAPKKVHFLKIDVEGNEYSVIAGNDWERNRPLVLCIESNHTNKNWSKLLTKNHYKLVISDSLNDYYVAQESRITPDTFVEKLITNNHLSLKKHYFESWQRDLDALELQKNKIAALEEEMKDQVYKNALSLRDVSLLRRLKRTAYGLTVDAYHFYKRK